MTRKIRNPEPSFLSRWRRWYPMPTEPAIRVQRVCFICHAVGTGLLAELREQGWHDDRERLAMCPDCATRERAA